MGTFLEVIREILKGVMREAAAYVLRKNVLIDEKTTLSRHKQKGGSRKNLKINFDNHHPDGRSCREKFLMESKTGA